MSMSYISLNYYILLGISVLLYYLLPLKHRWVVLLAASAVFYVWISTRKLEVLLFLAMILMTWRFSLALGKKKNRILLIAGILLTLVPLLAVRLGGLLSRNGSLIVPVGLSFWSLQMIAYLVDIYKGKMEPENNFFHYALFTSFFPQILQGPIPRWSQMGSQLIEGHRYDRKQFLEGIQLLIWGIFLKLVIANKAAVISDAVFNNGDIYSGVYAWIGAIAYTIDLYADFLSCVTMSQGVSAMFGISMMENFNHPYFSTSIQDFWRRWHISLSTWLRDYIYIPLGGNRKGKARKPVNILITFLVSGFWHGTGLTFLFWGLLHGMYQIIGNLTAAGREKLWKALKLDHTRTQLAIQILVNLFLVMIGWVFFRADSLHTAFTMIHSMFTVCNPWVLTDGSLLELGLTGGQWKVLCISILFWLLISIAQEKGIRIRDVISSKPLVIRWFIYLSAIVIIWVFGTYGMGFAAADFIYGGF